MEATVDPITIAAIGAGGAIVGGVLTSASNFVLERTKRTAARAAEDKLDARELRRSLRLIRAELVLCGSFLAAAQAWESWPHPALPLALPTNEWQTHKATLADYLTEGAWATVAEGYRVVEFAVEYAKPPFALAIPELAELKGEVEAATTQIQLEIQQRTRDDD